MLDLDRAFSALEEIAYNLKKLNTTIEKYIHEEKAGIEEDNQRIDSLLNLVKDFNTLDDKIKAAEKVNPFEPYTEQ